MGGVWERLIRTVRSVLSILLQEQGSQLDDKALRTLMTEVENPLRRISGFVFKKEMETYTVHGPSVLVQVAPEMLSSSLHETKMEHASTRL